VRHTPLPDTERRIRSVRRRLLRWYRDCGRDFPWRRTRDPWAVLLAELMLQRTRADLVPRVFEQTISRYPTARDFAQAPGDEIERLLRPLGYHHRNARLPLAAKHCVESVPRTMRGLLAVPGVGRYAAAATLCFAYGRRLAVVDPSVIRVVSRLGLGESRRARPRDDPSLWAAADALVPTRAAREWNYAILDLGATICQPKPRCGDCPLLTVCPTGEKTTRGAVESAGRHQAPKSA
jgi:A/G-specific adenine glycosylase